MFRILFDHEKTAGVEKTLERARKTARGLIANEPLLSYVSIYDDESGDCVEDLGPTDAWFTRVVRPTIGSAA